MQFETSVPARQAGGSFETPRNYPAPSRSDQNLRQHFQDLVSSTPMSTVGTPDSSSTGSMQPSQYNFQSISNPDGIPDLGAMMFPSGDPFAYPNQPMFEIENRQLQQQQQKPNNIGISLDGMQNMYMDPSGVASPFDNLEGQLFGPLPPYLVQGQPGYDMAQIGGRMPSMDPGMNNMGGHSGLTPGVGVGFNGNIFDGNAEEWNNMLASQEYRQ